MAQRFGEAVFGKTKYGNRCIICDSQEHLGLKYEFSMKVQRDNFSYWKCMACEKLKRGNPNYQQNKIPTVRLENDSNLILDDPDHPKNIHFCQATPAAEVEARQLDREMREQLKTSGKTPRAAHDSALAQLTEIHADDHQQRIAVEQHFPTYKTSKAGLYRAYSSKYPPIPSVNDIPDHLKMTLTGAKSQDPNDPDFREVYLIQEAPIGQPPFLVFASRMDLQTLRQSSHVVADGTFTYCPKEFSQLYVIFAFRGEEAVPVVHSLMPDRTTASYIQLFRILANKLMEHHDGLGQMATTCFHFDFESAAIAAAKTVFPQATIKGCLFHYAQALQRNIQHHGLQAVYEQRQNQGFHLPQFLPLKKWIRRLVAFSLLPQQLVLPTWQRVLSQLPLTGDPAVDQNIVAFRNYYVGQWLSDERLPLFNHADLDGPRTTNHAEGYNNSLAAKFSDPHPRLVVFLVKFQELHNSKQIRQRALMNGVAPVTRNPIYVANDVHIRQAKENFVQMWVNLTNTLEGHVLAMQMDQLILQYLDYVQHCLH